MEVSIVLIILAALVATMASNLWSRQDAMSYQQAILFFNRSLPNVMSTMKLSGEGGCFTSKGCSTGKTSANFTAMLHQFGAPATTEWGEDWTAGYDKGVVEIVYPIDSLSSVTKDLLIARIQEESLKGGALISHDAASSATTVPDSVIQGGTASHAGVAAGAAKATGVTDALFFYVKAR